MIHSPMLFISGIGFWEILLVLLVILLLFGAKRLPEIARGLGRGMKEFKKELKDTGRDWEDEEKLKSRDAGDEGKREPSSPPEPEDRPPKADGPAR